MVALNISASSIVIAPRSQAPYFDVAVSLVNVRTQQHSRLAVDFSVAQQTECTLCLDAIASL